MGGHNGNLALSAELVTGGKAGRTFLSLPDDLPVARWSRIGAQLASVSDASAWWIGDWLVFGQERYGDRYRRAMAETSLNYQTLRNYAWVARRFESARRREKLTFQHHLEVAALCADEQDHWLDLAVRLRWSRNELRKQIRNSEADEVFAEPGEIQLRLSVQKERVDQWEEAARLSHRNLAEWIEHSLDQASHPAG